MRLAGAILGFITACAGQAAAQTAAPTVPAKQVLSVIDDDPIASARADAMGGAITPLADDLDAAFHNPAGIGGLKHDDKGKDRSWIRKLYFPWLSLGENQNSQKLMADIKSQGGAKDSTIGKAVVDQTANEREYGRANLVSGMVLGRIMVVPFEDIQLASTARGQGTNLLDTNYREMNGAGAGFSVQDSAGRLALGYFGYAATKTTVNAPLDYQSFIDTKVRNQELKDNTVKETGIGNNVGLDWRMGNKASPTLGVSVKNAGGTRWKSSSGTTVQKEDLSIGFAVEPQLGKSGAVNFVLQADKLEETDLALIKKYKIGTELLLGGIGSYATFALRGGYNYAGPSGGLMLNLGLIGFEAAVYSQDIAADNARVVERRGQATFFVNVADF